MYLFNVNSCLLNIFMIYENCPQVCGPAKIKPVLRNKRSTGPNVLHGEKVFTETVYLSVHISPAAHCVSNTPLRRFLLQGSFILEIFVKKLIK